MASYNSSMYFDFPLQSMIIVEQSFARNYFLGRKVALYLYQCSAIFVSAIYDIVCSTKSICPYVALAKFDILFSFLKVTYFTTLLVVIVSLRQSIDAPEEAASSHRIFERYRSSTLGLSNHSTEKLAGSTASH